MKRIGILALLSLLVACAQPEKKEDAEAKPAFRAMGQSVKTDESHNDESIGFAVRRQLELIGPGDTAGIVVEVNDAVVTLRGVTPTRLAAWRAEGAARSVKGVKNVVNQIVAGFSSPSY